MEIEEVLEVYLFLIELQQQSVQQPKLQTLQL